MNGLIDQITDLDRAAEVYARAGWPVFPLATGSKAPAISKRAGGSGFEDATTDLGQIRAWWQRYPSANIGAPTGVKFDVFDIDVRASGDGWEHYDRLAAAGLLRGSFAVARTRNAGAHLFYPPSGAGCRSFKGKYLDVKGRGGYIVLAPSRVPADVGIGGPGAYSWHEFDTDTVRAPLDVAAIGLFLSPPLPAPRGQGVGSVWGEFARTTGRSVDALITWLGRQSLDRNNALYWAARKAVVAGQLDADAKQRFAAVAIGLGLSAHEVERTLTSAQKGPSV